VILDTNGDLERAIEYYSNAVDNGIDQAQKNLRNAKAKLIGRKIY
jgi:TPR repeat protein